MKTRIDSEQLQSLVRQAGQLFADRQAAGHTRTKGAADFVTEVDVGVQEFLRRELAMRWPQVQFLSEEKNNDEVDRNAPVWVLDPVDGTTNLIHDYHASVISLALMEEGKTVLGLVWNPYLNEMYFAENNKGCFRNGIRVCVSAAQTMEESLIAVGTTPYHKELAAQNFEAFRRIFLDCQDIRRSGSAALDLASVACGRLDGYFERDLKLWDYAAGLLLVREAGGVVTDYEGVPLKMDLRSDVIAGTPAVAAALREYLFVSGRVI